MTINELLEEWNKTGRSMPPGREYRVRLPSHDAARIVALSRMYPLKNEELIIAELLSAALDTLEAALPPQWDGST